MRKLRAGLLKHLPRVKLVLNSSAGLESRSVLTLTFILTISSAVSEPEDQGCEACRRLCFLSSSLGHTGFPPRETPAQPPSQPTPGSLHSCPPHSHPSSQLPFSILPVDYTPQNCVPSPLVRGRCPAGESSQGNSQRAGWGGGEGIGLN